MKCDTEEKVVRDIFSGEEVKKEYELYQSYERFNVYKVYKINSKTEKRTFLYITSKSRCDFGRKMKTKKEILEKFDKLEEIDGRKGIKE